MVQIDELIRSRRRTLSLMITKDARVIVRAPLRLPLREIEKFVLDKSDWIKSKKNTVLKRLELAQNACVSEGGQFSFLGAPLVLVFDAQAKNVKCESGKLLVPLHKRENATALVKRWYQKQAKLILGKRLEGISQLIGIPYQGLRVSGARRRWGSCSGQNHISLTWRLVMANQEAIDYVIVHELCHVIHKNHSRYFWNKVGEILPDYAKRRQWLKANAYLLDVLE